MRNLIAAIRCPYRVFAMGARHYASSFSDALEWAACYPREELVLVVNRWGRVVAGRPPC